MAVRVIDEAPDPAVVRRVSCRKCGARLEFVPIDIIDGVDIDYTGDRDPYAFVRCPKCKNEVRVDKYARGGA